MADKYPPSKQRAALKKLTVALNSSSTALRVDGCGDPSIIGSHGHIYAVCGTLRWPTSPGFTFYLDAGSSRAWTAAKAALKFAEVDSDGDVDGWLSMYRLPTPEEATTIRRYLGIRQRRTVSDDAKDALIARLRAPVGPPSQAQGMPSNTLELHP
jgi:hypothetical protein